MLFKDKKQLLKYYDKHIFELISRKDFKQNDLEKDIAIIFKGQSKSGTPKNLKYTIHSGESFKTDRMFLKEEEEPQGPGTTDGNKIIYYLTFYEIF